MDRVLTRLNHLNNSTFIDYLLLGILALIWSTSFLLIKVAIDTIGPFTLTSGRLVLAAAVLSILLWIKKESLPTDPKAITLYLVVGIVGNALPFALISLGEVYIDSSLAAILMGIMPISTFVLAHFFISSESMTTRKVVGVAFGFLGLVTLVGLTAFRDISGQLFGQLVVLTGALCYSVTTVFVRRFTMPGDTSSGGTNLQGIQMATGALIVAAVLSVPAALLFENPENMTPDIPSILSGITLGIFHTGLAALIYFRVIANLGAVTFAQINYLVPVLGSIWGY